MYEASIISVSVSVSRKLALYKTYKNYGGVIISSYRKKDDNHAKRFKCIKIC